MKPRDFVAAMVGVLLFYVLCTGPANRYRYANMTSPYQATRFEVAYWAAYTPLFWTYRRSSAVKSSIDWYVNLWIPST